MKSQKFKRVIVVLLVTAMAVAIPSSFAKYADSVTIENAMTVKRKMFTIFNTYTGISKEERIVRLPQIGYYAIIAKGGDGANGDAYEGDISQGYKQEGGIGGTVVGVYQTTEPNQYLYVAPGSAGGRSNPNCKPNEAIMSHVIGVSGKNSAHLIDGYFAGGSGSDLGTGFLDGLAGAFSKAPASGGGGAATLVYACDKDGKYTSADVLFVAAGGGAGGVWNAGYKTGSTTGTNILGTSDPAGFGGDGGSNFFGGIVSAPISYANSSYAFSFTTIYDGFNGTGMVSSIDTRGKAGTSKGVGAAVTSEPGGLGGLLTAKTSSPGKTFANGGNGGDGAQYGGGGGAGYYGGSGGVSTSIRNQGWTSTKQPAGGGGGGASYIAPSIIQTENVGYAFIIDSVSSGDKCIPTQHPAGDYTAEGDGYVVIKYLGSTLPNEETSVMASAMSRYIVQKYNNSNIIDTITNTTSTTNSFYKTLMSDTAISNFLSGRAWSIEYGRCERLGYNDKYDINIIPILYFSEKNLTVANGATITVWRYKEGKLSKATNVKVSRTGSGTASKPYVYSLNNPSSGTYNTEADFALN